MVRSTRSPSPKKRFQRQAALVALLTFALGLPQPSTAQASPAPTPPAQTAPPCPAPGEAAAKPCTPPARRSSVTDQFPYPGEAPAAADHTSPAPSASDRFPYPGEPTPQTTKPAGSPADRFPYPGETPPSDASSSSSTSAPGATPDPDARPNPDRPDLKDEGSQGEVKHRRRLRPPAQKTLSDAERVDEDLSVAHFYLQSGNTMGSYLRAKDAVKLQPDAPDTHLALAEAADRLGKRDEAVTEYRAVLTADPDSQESRLARKALDRIRP